MPLYEFRCDQCGAVFEKMLRFSESDNKAVCPECDSPWTKKKISKVASFASDSASGSSAPAGSCGSRGGFG